MPEWWYINNVGEKIHPTTAFSENFSMESLFRLSGVEHFRVNVDDLENDDKFIELRKKRGYDYEDLVDLSTEALPNLKDKLQEFFTEHLHEDEEIRLFLEGSAYFDVRNSYDEWCRIRADKGDLLILPAGIYHRFTLDDKNCCKVKRYFCGNPVWKALNRPTDCPARHDYLKSVAEMRRQDSRLTG